MNIEIYRDVDASVPPKDNAFWDIIKGRTAFVHNPDTIVKTNRLRVFTIDRNVIFRRRPVEALKMESIDGETYVTSPMMASDIEKKKDTSTFLFSKDEIVIEYTRTGDCFNEIADLSRKTAIKTIEHLINKKVEETPTHDFLVDKKKIGGTSTFKNPSGVHESMIITMIYDPEEFKKYLSDRDDSPRTGYGITSMKLEEESVSVDKFIDSFVYNFVCEFKKLNPQEEMNEYKNIP